MSQYEPRYIVTEAELLKLVWKNVLCERKKSQSANLDAMDADAQARSRPILPDAVPLTRYRLLETFAKHLAVTGESLGATALYLTVDEIFAS